MANEPLTANERQSQPSAGPAEPPTRIVIREFTQDNLVVQVQKTLAYHPYYAIIIGTRNRNDPVQINRGIFPLRFEGMGNIKESPGNLDPITLSALTLDAINFARDCRQQDEDKEMQKRIERENYNANRGKPVTHKTGKTERERNKRKRHND